MNSSPLSESQGRAITWLLSVLLLLGIAFLYIGPKLISIGGLSPSTLPKVNAGLNAVAALLLLMAWRAVLAGNIVLHRRLMLTAVVVCVVFLVSYVVQHGSFPSVKYGGRFGWFYYPMLVSHILLAAMLVPLVSITLVRALGRRFDKHRKIARWTLPIWLYVSLTGVLIYLMCAPYY